MKLPVSGMVLFLFVAACTDQKKQVSLQQRGCENFHGLDIPASAILGQWRESEFVEMRTSTSSAYWIKRNHVLTREGQLTTREEICGDEACLDPKAEITHFGTYTFDSDKGTILKSYRKHFFSAFDESWMKASFDLAKCRQQLISGQVVSLEDSNCLQALRVKSEETWVLKGATLKSLALKNCTPQLRASSDLTRELVRMF